MTDTTTELPAMAGPAVNALMAAQLRAAADLIEKTSGLKVSAFAGIVIPYFTDGTGEVDAMAALLGVKAQWNGNHYSAGVQLGPHVAYSALHICRCHCKPAPAAETPKAAA